MRSFVEQDEAFCDEWTFAGTHTRAAGAAGRPRASDRQTSHRRGDPANALRSRVGDLYYEEAGEGAPILVIHPAGSTASTWGAVVEQLAGLGPAISYDRRGYARSAGDPVHSASTHTADAAAILVSLAAAPAVVVGTSAGAAIGVDLAVRHPELVRGVVAHEFPWRYTRHVPAASQVTALVKIGSYALAGRNARAVETLLRSAYSYRDGGSAWDAFLGARAQEIEGAGHAAPFDATSNFVELVVGTISTKVPSAA